MHTKHRPITRAPFVAVWLLMLAGLAYARPLHAYDSPHSTLPAPLLSTAPAIDQADPQSVTMSEDGNPDAFSLSLSATDVATTTLTWSLATPPSNGTANTSNLSGTPGVLGDVNYAPNQHFNGSDSFVVQVKNDDDLTDTITVSVMVQAVNDAPSFTPGGPVTVNEDSDPYAAAWATAISPGPNDEAGQTVTFQLTGNTNPDLFSVAPAIAPGGALSFTLKPNASGTANVTVRLRDSGGTANGGADTSGPVTLTITVNPVNDAPVIDGLATRSVTMSEDGAPTGFSLSLSASDVDDDDNGLIWSISTPASRGTASVSGTGSSKAINYAPNPNEFGSDSFVVKVADGKGGEDTVTVNVTIQAVNDAPSFVKGPDQSVAINSGPRTVANWATSISPGPNESGQTVDFNVSNDNNGLFSAQPAVSSDGTLTFTPAPGQRGSATVTVSAEDSGGASSSSQTFTIAVSSVDLALTKSDGDVSAAPGSVIVYTLAYGNNGNKAAANVVIVETVPAGTTFRASDSDSGWSCADGSAAGVVCEKSIGSVAPGGSGQALFAVRVNEPLGINATAIQNSASIATNSDDMNPGNNQATESTPLDVDVAFSVTKEATVQVDTDENGQPSPGDVLRYDIVITHDGNAPATSVVLTDVLDVNTTLQVGSVDASTGVVVSGNQAGDRAVEVAFGSIEAASVVTLTYHAAVKTPLPAGVNQVSNQAFVSGGNIQTTPSDDPGKPGASDPTVVSLRAQPRLAVEKRATPGRDQTVTPGQTIDYAIAVVNRGNQNAAAVVVTDVVDGNTRLTPDSVNTDRGAIVSGNNPNDSAVRVEVGPLGVGERVEITFQVRVKDLVSADAAVVSNQAVVASAGAADVVSDDPTADGATDPTVTGLFAEADLSATLIAFLYGDNNGTSRIEPGDTILYVAKLVNRGNRAAGNVIFENLLDSSIATQGGAVNSSTGEVTAGNTAGSDTVTVAIADLAGGGQEATISYRVRVRSIEDLPLAPDADQEGTRLLLNQGVVRYRATNSGDLVEVRTDDPAAPGQADQTPLLVHEGAVTELVFLPLIAP